MNISEIEAIKRYLSSKGFSISESALDFKCFTTSKSAGWENISYSTELTITWNEDGYHLYAHYNGMLNIKVCTDFQGSSLNRFTEQYEAFSNGMRKFVADTVNEHLTKSLTVL